jgi:predicted ATPase
VGHADRDDLIARRAHGNRQVHRDPEQTTRRRNLGRHSPTLTTRTLTLTLHSVWVVGGTAVQLFVERAVAVQPRFVLTERNATDIAEVCQRLDGIPLALELAAARIEALTVHQVAARLDQCFRLLTAGSRTAVPRQQTLRATLGWSYDLLGDAQKCLFNDRQ